LTVAEMDTKEVPPLPKNVNEYAHLIQASIRSHQELEWYLYLRKYVPRTSHSTQKIEQPPSFLRREVREPKGEM